MSDVLIGLAGVLVGFVLQAVNAYASDRRAEQREHRKWLAQIRYERFTRLVEDMRILRGLAINSGSEEEVLAAWHTFDRSRLLVNLVLDDSSFGHLDPHLELFAEKADTDTGEDDEVDAALSEVLTHLSFVIRKGKTLGR